jgi:hypothetical protein
MISVPFLTNIFPKLVVLERTVVNFAHHHFSMKINSLLYALPVLLLTSCYDSGTDASTGNTADYGSKTLAKQVAGVNTIKSDIIYEEPCAIVDEEFLRKTFNLGEDVKLEDVSAGKGCEFEWAGNKVMLSFGGKRPFQSMFIASYQFDKLYQGKAKGEDDVAKADTLSTATVTATPGEGVGTPPDSAKGEADDDLPQIKPAVAHGNYEPVMNVGDKAVWNASEGALHVLFINHIINIQVETKDKNEVKKERAKLMAEVLMERITDKEYFRAMESH